VKSQNTLLLKKEKTPNQKSTVLNVKGGDNYTTMKSINISRQQLIAESLIRDHIRSRISVKASESRIAETKLRRLVKTILEAETGTEEPSEYTGINVLASLLEKIIPIIEDDYKMLTTSEEQRESFRNHIVQAFKNALKPIEASTEAEKTEENTIFDLDKDLLVEKVKVNISSDDDPADAVAGEFIDIDEPSDKDSFVKVDDQNETGRNFAADTFHKVEKQTVDAYDMLADEEDQRLFYDYLITNMLLYFDKFEDELQHTLPGTTTPEYEDNKDQVDTADTAEADEESSEDSEDSEDSDLF
jgi:hypothetical protein